ncbi:hypothetical protein DSM25558_5497 [Agrobacterium sp. DSM 25558]|uniref:Uncharacterized protein n=1 Tax=Agrobacterium rosae TaxID=1972867 RepID=A0A1R3U2G6_9HYPH|nr:hypothetical protein DSM25558_5497 [Agrobacterium sp. DSM 25558]SCX35678.1 hypothetical protein DSM25559_5095 [Agrobacterium rosae]
MSDPGLLTGGSGGMLEIIAFGCTIRSSAYARPPSAKFADGDQPRRSRMPRPMSSAL